MDRQIFDMESGPLAIYIYRDDTILACARARTNGGWDIHIGEPNPFYHMAMAVAVTETRSEAEAWLRKRFRLDAERGIAEPARNDGVEYL